jgi:hypothetical protein
MVRLWLSIILTVVLMVLFYNAYTAPVYKLPAAFIGNSNPEK